MKHRKFLRLAAMIGGRALARGHLELLWETAYECGNDDAGDAKDVEIVADWQGEPGKLAEALLTCGGEGEAGFIEQDPERPGRYRIHDLLDHAPDYVRKRMMRESARQALGVTLREQRAAAGRASGAARRRSPAADQQTGTPGEQTATNGEHEEAKSATPAPAPAPAPAPQQTSGAAPAAPDPSGPPFELSGKPPGKPAKHGKHAKPNPDVKRLLDQAVAACQEFRGFKPVIRGAPEAQAMTALLSGRGFEEAARIVREFYRDPPDWNLDHATLGLTNIPAAATKILARLAGGNGKRDSTGAPVSGSGQAVEDTIEVDEAGVEREVRIWRSAATGEVTARRWGKPVKREEVPDGGQRVDAAAAH